LRTAQAELRPAHAERPSLQNLLPEKGNESGREPAAIEKGEIEKHRHEPAKSEKGQKEKLGNYKGKA
jgi:hypothetical protein